MTKIHRFVALDGLRGIAAVIVVQWHFANWFDGWRSGNGYLAVDFFFLLSGFVLEFAYGKSLERPRSAANFLIARLARLYPMYLLSVIIVIYAIRFAYSPFQAGLAVAMLPETDGVWGVAPAWSLAFELLVNIAFALTYKRLNLPTLLTICAASLIGLIMAYHRYGTLDVGFSTQNFLGGIPRVSFSFFLGVILFKKRETMSKIVPKSSVMSCLMLTAILVAPGHKYAGVIYDLISVTIMFPVILISSAYVDVGRIANRLFRLGGSLSYPIYILHTSLGALLFRWGLWPALERNPPWGGVLAILTMCAVSLGVERFVDRPIRTFLKTSGRPLSNSNQGMSRP